MLVCGRAHKPNTLDSGPVVEFVAEYSSGEVACELLRSFSVAGEPGTPCSNLNRVNSQHWV